MMISSLKLKYHVDFLKRINSARTYSTKISSCLHQVLKHLGILRTFRGCRSGKTVKEKLMNNSNAMNIQALTSTHRRVSSKFAFRKKTLREIKCTKFIHGNSDKGLRCKFAFWNSRSMGNKCSAISDLVLTENLDVLTITETWLKSEKSQVDLKIADLLNTLSDHVFINVPRQSKGGGIGVLLKKGFKVQHEHVQTFTTFEHLNLLITSGATCLRLVAIYRPPPSSKNKFTVSKFLSEFSTFTESLLISSGKILICGDFNFHVNDSTDKQALSFIDLLETTGFQQHVHEPTHKRGHTLDLLITNNSESFVSNIRVLDGYSSDHFIVTSNLMFPKPLPTKISVNHRSLKQIDRIEFCNDIISSALYTDDHHPDVELLTDQYNNVLRNLMEKFAPESRREITVRPHAPWYNSELREGKRTRRRLERKYCKTKLAIDRAIYQEYCLNYHQLLEMQKSDYHTTKFRICDKQMLFTEMNTMLNGKRKLALPTKSYSQTSLPDLFASFFHQKIISLTSNLTITHTLSVHISESCCYKFDKFQELCPDKVKTLVQKARTKSCNLDPIPTVILKDCLDPLTDTITSIINTSLSTGIIPSHFKSALVTPILKKTSLDHEILSNYRPVSNLPFLSKILERAVAEQLNKYLHDNKLHPHLQSAYRIHHSTETALLRVHNDILIDLDDGKQVVVVLLDFSAAFDTIDHKLLLARLKNKFGIDGMALKWLTDYLSFRTQSVFINGTTSNPVSLSYGVPQGSVLGPLLFTLYITPLEDVICAHKIPTMFYADDSKLYVTLDTSSVVVTITQIENCMKDIKAWATSNRLIFNDSKTEVVHIVSKFNKHPMHFPGIEIGDAVVSPVTEARDLGVILDHNMSMESHINNTCKSASFALHKIGRIRKYLDNSTCETLIHAFITSRLDTCNSLLYGLPSHLHDKLQRIQNAAARMVTRTRKSEHITPILRKLHWLPVHKRIQFKILLLTFKALHGVAPTYLTDLLKIKIPSRTLRSEAKGVTLIQPRSKTRSFGDRAFCIAAPTLWNNLPKNIKDSESIEIFKSKVKTFLFNSF